MDEFFNKPDRYGYTKDELYGLGGGGGGAGGSPMASGAGGSGTVILAIPSGSYPYVTAVGAVVSNPPAAPGRTVLTYTAPNPQSPVTYTFIGP